eukprot:GHVQ01019231.1.p1 GENE.GHVQ01019231.1~~GHVQ01019231.1.p1  ORF type:complete len:140 (-),score=13.35 GHVQ01019231.1:220-639(-)
MKLSQDIEKTSIPSRKAVYRLYSKTGKPCLDVLQRVTAPPPIAGEKLFCRHLFDDTKRCYVVPTRVESLLEQVWDKGRRVDASPSLMECRGICLAQLQLFREDHLRPINPTPYKVSGTSEFYSFFHKMWETTAPVFTIE